MCIYNSIKQYNFSQADSSLLPTKAKLFVYSIMTKLLPIVSLPVLFSFASFSYECDLTGHLGIPHNSMYLSVKKIEVFVKADGKLLGKTKTDRKGNFKLFFLVNREKE